MSKDFETIEIVVRINVPKGYEAAAISVDGYPVIFSEGSEPRQLSHSWGVERGFLSLVPIENWRETLTRVKRKK